MNKAQTIGYQLVKRAGPTSEVLGAGVTGGLANLGAALAALGTQTRMPEDVGEGGQAGLTNFIPGVGGYRTLKRLGASAREYERDTGEKTQLVPEFFGRLTSPVALALLGALAGGVSGRFAGGKGDPASGALLGALIGGGTGALSNVIGSGAGILSKHRTKPEQYAYEKSSPTLTNLLVPGMADYNITKRLGYTREWDEQARQDEELRRVVERKTKEHRLKQEMAELNKGVGSGMTPAELYRTLKGMQTEAA